MVRVLACTRNMGLERITLTVVLSSVIVFSYVSCQTTPSDVRFVCNAQTNCQDCILANPMCAWCATTNFNGTNRCYLPGSSDAPMCNASDVQNPKGREVNRTNATFSIQNQVSPQRISLILRPGEPVSFRLAVQPARNFPLDLYLLMDLSASMNDDLANLKRLGNEIVTRINSITNDFTLGFGSFVEKTLAPFVNVYPPSLIDPCSSRVCESPYSYIHAVSLTTDSASFNTRVQALRTSGNQDGPEGGFDGFLQAIVCQQLIGWRTNARRLLLYISDAGFHFAGDGKLAGVVRPHPGVCLMNASNTGNQRDVNYTDFDKFDYPSIGQINEKLREFDIIPILAATSGASQFYMSLAQELIGSTVGQLAQDSSNVVDLIETAYRTVSQRVIVSPDLVPEIVFNITPTSSCPSVDADGHCAGIQIEETAEVNVELTLVRCSDALLAGPIEIPVRILGFGSMTIEVNALCNCGCESNPMNNSDVCTGGNGTLTCGICECNSGRFGDLCQCDSTGLVAGSNITTACPRGSNNLECSGSNRGQCVCGQCQCRRFNDGTSFFGTACECDNFQCDRDPETNLICGGPERGRCTCDGTCQCLSSSLSGLPYTGSACDCSPDNNTCIDPSTNRQCNGNGQCMCGDCDCTRGYSGQYCERCTISSICPRLTCDDNRNCAMCEKMLSTENCDQCRTVLVNQITDPNNYQINNNSATVCEFRDDENCAHRFFVALDSEGATQPVHVERERVCPAAVVQPWIPAVSIIAALLVAGVIALIIIKIILVLLDFFEVKKFMKEVQDPKFRKNENPLFQAPTKEYKNPIYGE